MIGRGRGSVSAGHRSAARAAGGGASRAAAAGAAVLVVLVGGCGSGGPVTPPVPTFADRPAATARAVAPRATLLPTDCTGVLPPEELVALAGWPLGTATGSTVHDVPAPTAGRVERMICPYTRLGAPAGSPPALRVVLAVFTDPGAAAAQLAANDVEQRRTASTAVPVVLGAVTGSWYIDTSSPGPVGLLALREGRDTLELTVPAATAPTSQAQSFAEDLALRILPTLPPPAGP